MFYAIINYQFKASELKKGWEVDEANSESLRVLLEWTGNVHFRTVCEIIFLVSGPWKVLEKWLQFFVWTLPQHKTKMNQQSFPQHREETPQLPVKLS